MHVSIVCRRSQISVAARDRDRSQPAREHGPLAPVQRVASCLLLLSLFSTLRTIFTGWPSTDRATSSGIRYVEAASSRRRPPPSGFRPQKEDAKLIFCLDLIAGVALLPLILATDPSLRSQGGWLLFAPVPPLRTPLRSAMPSYNLPHYGPIPSSSPPRHRPPPLNFSHSPPSPSPPPAPLSPPASVKQRFTSQWTPRRHYCRSPLALSVLTPHLIKNIRRQHWEHHPALSRRYLRPPPLSACAAVQAFQRPPFSYTMTEGRDPREIQEVEDRLFEEMVSRTIERRLGEKVARTKMAGERAGLGVAAGREMMLWSALGRVRESRRKGECSSERRQRRNND